MQRRSSATLLALAGLVVAWSLVATGAHAAGAAAILPVLVLLVPLLARRYPGEERIARLRDRRRCVVRHARAADATTPRTTPYVVARGTLVLARGLAVRPPPGRPAHA